MSNISDLAKEILVTSLPEEFVCTSDKVINGGNRYANLLDEAKEERKPLPFNSTGFPFHLKEPKYVTEVKVSTTAKTSKLRIDIRPADGERWERFTPESVDKNTGTVIFKVDRLAASVRLLCDKSLFGREKNESVTRVSIAGVGIGELHRLALTYESAKQKFAEFNSTVSVAMEEIDESKAELKKKTDESNAQFETLNVSIEKLEEKKSSLEVDVNTAETESAVADEKLKQVTGELELKKSKAEETQTRLAQLESQVEERQADKERLVKESVELRADVQRLTDNKNLFSDNLEGLTAQADRNIRVYAALFAAPVLIMAMAGVYLLWQAHEFFVLVLNKPPTDLKTLFIARSPLVVLGYALISGCWRLSSMFGRKIMEIQDFRLRASTLTTIATDVTHAAAIGLDLTDAEKYQLRTHLKMQLLREQFASAFPSASRPASDKVVQKIVAKLESGTSGEDETDRNELAAAAPRPVLTASRPAASN